MFAAVVAVAAGAALCGGRGGGEVASSVPPAPVSPQTSVGGQRAETEVVLCLKLGDPTGPVLRYLPTPGLDAVALWPDWPLPQLQTTTRLRDLAEDLSGRNRPETRNVVHEMLLVADEEGIGSGEDEALRDPGRAFVELEVARWRAGHAYHHEIDAWMKSLVGPGEEIRGRFGELWLSGPDRPVQDNDELLELAREVAARFPGHPVADHARLAEVLGSFPKGLREGDPFDPGPAFDALATIEEPALAEQAALHLTLMDRWIPVPPAGLATLARVSTSHPDAELAISSFGLDRALASGDLAGAAEWRRRVEAAVRASCPPDDAELPCTASRETLTDATARLAATDRATPGSWQEAVGAAAWRCVYDGSPQDGSSIGRGRFTAGRWTWGGWDRATRWTACLEAVEIGPPAPPEGLVVRLEAVGR